MTDLQSELTWLAEAFDDHSHAVESEWGGAPRPAHLFAEDRRRAKAIFARLNWQPIETAPKDGSRILIWAGWSFEEPDFHIAAWEEDIDPGKGDPPRMRWCTGEEGGHGSRVAYDDPDVTYWKPLDPPV